jgi:hypothetical protein
MGLPFWRVGSFCIFRVVVRVGGSWQILAWDGTSGTAPRARGVGLSFGDWELSGNFGHSPVTRPSPTGDSVRA